MSTGVRRRRIWTIFALVATGFALRAGYRLYEGEASLWNDGYTFFFELGRNIAAGRGLGFGAEPTAFRVPAYPVFLAAVTLGHRTFLPIVLSQAAVGAGTVLCSALLASELFGSTAAILAGGLTAIYPYYVVHDTAMQETSLFTLLTLLSVLVLLRTWRTRSRISAAAAGLMLGLDVLTRATIAPFALLAVLWLYGKRGAAALICAGVLTVVVAPWLIRSYRLTGAFTLTTETGLQLWDGNNPYTFTYYPHESIDRSKAAALEALSLRERVELEALRSNEAWTDAWFWRKGRDYIRNHPWLALRNGVRKITVVFGWWPSPRKGVWANSIHLVSFGPVMALGLAGMFLHRKAWREHMIFYALFVSFAAVTAVFFGHTSHRSYLDVYWIVFAAGLLGGWFPAKRAVLTSPETFAQQAAQAEWYI